MFENVIGQSAVLQLGRDAAENRLAPAMLFHGPSCSGKGTSALELARAVSCENGPHGALWNCACSSCVKHRRLLHLDLLCLGSRPFSAEIAASKETYLRDSGNAAAKALFFRSARKLLSRFAPALWEDEPKLSKLNPLISSLEENLDLLDGLDSGQIEKVEKVSSSVVKDALKLEGEGVTDSVPIAQIRRVSSWAHLLPSGLRKTLIIENADRMQDGARNSLLKLLEEPPDLVTIILVTSRPGAMLPTILSRLRPYRFSPRVEEAEMEVIRRVFRNARPAVQGAEKKTKAENGSLVSAYLDSFLPVPEETLKALASYFAASAAKKAALLIREKGKELPEIVAALGRASSAVAEEAGLGPPARENREAVSTVMKGASNFELRSLFPRFLRALLLRVSESEKLLSSSPGDPPYREMWNASAGRAGSAVTIYNQSPVLALERLFTEASRGMAELCGSL